MKSDKKLATARVAVFVGGAVLALGLIWPSISIAQNKKAKVPDSHAKHKDKQPAGDQDLASQILELGAKVARLEAALEKSGSGTSSATPDTGGLAGQQEKAGGGSLGDRISSQYQNCLQCHETRPSGPVPPSHLEQAGESDKGTAGDAFNKSGQEASVAAGQKETAPDKGMSGTGGGEMRMMEKMMGMMEKMMGGMSGGAMQSGKGTPAAGGMGMMEDDMDEMSPMQSSQGAPGGGASGSSAETGMMKKMDKMMGMMEKMMDGGAMQPGKRIRGTGGMGGDAPSTSVESRIMKKMDKMMGMMEKLMDGGGIKSGQGMPAAGGMQDM